MSTNTLGVIFPRVVITFCVQCKWNLRAAYYAQELLQTFADKVGEVALVPVTGGIFTVEIYHRPTSADGRGEEDTQSGSHSENQSRSEAQSQSHGPGPGEAQIQHTLLWDRKIDGGFPETKELKNRVRNVIDPGRDMGHVDRALKKQKGQGQQGVDAKANANAQMKTETKGEGAGTAHEGHASATTGGVPEDCAECRDAAAEAQRG